MYSSPRWQWVITATRLPCVPLGTNSAASLSSIAAMRSCSALTVGSSPNTSSPSSARIIASRMPGVGRVTVSLRRSMIFMVATSIEVIVDRCLAQSVAGRIALVDPRKRGPSPFASCGQLQEVLQHRVPMFAEDRFGVELHAFERGRRARQLTMAHPHDLAIFGGRRDIEHGRQGLTLDRQRVV